MREFVTATYAASQAGQEDEVFGFPIEVPVDGRKINFNPATTAQITMVIAAMEGDLFRKVANIVDFFFSLVDKDEDKAWFRKRLFDSRDAFSPGMMEEIVVALIEEWGGRPTPPASDSSQPPQVAGKSSTARRHSKASTRSASPSTASST